MCKRFSGFIAVFFLFATSLKAQVVFPDINVQHYTFALTLNDKDNIIQGKASVTIKFLNDISHFPLNLVKKNSDGKGMLVSAVSESGKNLRFEQDDDIVNIYTEAKNNSIHTFTIDYSGIPADGLIISTSKFGRRTFFGDNWPNRAHNWLPCADYPSDKATVDFFVVAPDHYQVVANGLKVEENNLPNHQKLTHYREKVPIPTKVMVIGVADFAIQQSGTVYGIPVYSYVFPENKEAGFKSYAYAPEILKYYIDKFGPYAYEKLANVQSKTIYGGMENAGAIFYTQDSIGVKWDEELLAHEIAHQWFGDAITEKSWKNLWLSEGFATYMTNCYLEHKYGSDTLKKRLIAERKLVLNLERRRFTPVVDSAVTGNFQQLLNHNSYEKGAWALHMLRRKLGDSAFWKGIRAYYAKYEDKNDNTADFEHVMEKSSGQNLSQFFKQWLYTAGNPHLDIVWKYDADKKAIDISITQKQNTLFEFPLQYAIGGKFYSIEIKDRETNVSIPAAAKPVTVKIDPDVNLLAAFEVQEE